MAGFTKFCERVKMVIDRDLLFESFFYKRKLLNLQTAEIQNEVAHSEPPHLDQCCLSSIVFEFSV